MPTPTQPTTNSLLTLLPIMLSAIAIFVSLASAAFTAYLQYFRKPKLDVLVSRWLRTWIGGNDELVINAAITFTNSGAQYAVVTRVSGVLLEVAEHKQLNVQWSKFITYENAAPVGESFKPHGSFAGWADYLVVPNRQVIANNIQFFTNGAFAGRPGRYRLQLTAYAGSGTKSKAIALAEVEFDITEADAEKLKSTIVDPDTKVSKASVVFATTHV